MIEGRLLTYNEKKGECIYDMHSPFFTHKRPVTFKLLNTWHGLARIRLSYSKKRFHHIESCDPNDDCRNFI